MANILNKVEKRTKQKIEFEIVSFLNENKNQLPFYHIPQLQPIALNTKEEHGEDEKEDVKE